jgi:hypothetical protein
MKPLHRRGLLILLAMLLAVFAVLPFLRRRSESGPVPPSCINLNQIGIALQMYAWDNGMLPPSLSALSPKYLSDTRIFLDPRAPDYRHKLSLRQVDPSLSIVGYSFEPAVNVEDKTTVLAYESTPVNNTRFAFRISEGVDLMDEPAFQKQIAQQRAHYEAKSASSSNSPSR